MNETEGVGRTAPVEKNPLGETPVPRLLLMYAPPAILSMMVSALYNLIDTFFVGNWVGQDGIAATTVAFPLMMLMSAFGAWFGAGGNAYAALKLGEGKTEEANRTLGNSLFMLIVVPLAVSATALVFLDPLLDLLGATDANRGFSHDFCRVILMGFVIQAAGVGLSNFVRTDGSPNYALVVNIAGTVAAVFFNWLFVTMLDMKMTGSALATVLGQAVTSAMVLQYFLSGRSRMTLRAQSLKPAGRLVKAIAALGLSTFAVQVASALTASMLNLQITALGPGDPIGADGGLAVIGTVNKVISLLFFVTMGFAVAAQPIIGFNYGAQRYRRVRQAFWITVASAVATNLVLWIACHVFIGPIMGFFNLSEDLHGFAAQTFLFMTLLFPVVPFQVVGSNYFQASGQPLKATFLTLTRQLLFYLPCLFIVPPVMSGITGMTGLACLPLAPAFADGLAILTTTFFVVKEMRRLKALSEDHDARLQGHDEAWAGVDASVRRAAERRSA